MANKRIDEATGTETMGHEWDGIEELNTPLPKWWLYTFYACIAFAIGYVIVYPAIPMIHGATPGIWGWTSRGQLDQEMKKEQAERAPILAAIAKTPLDQLVTDEKLNRQAIEGGAAAFKVNCVQCHGAGAQGSVGYPNLNDDDWLWGGTIDDIAFTITHGVRQAADPESRMSQMPSFGKDGILTPDQVGQVVSYVRTISNQDKPSASSQAGAAIFAANCAVCHGADGKGSQAVGAPNLTDGIWLYGGSVAALTNTVTNAHYGQMPNWGARLDPVTIKMLAAYVFSRGGGKAAAPAAAPSGTGTGTPAQ
ncbi:MAG: cytochrome-c oxidase, cbb3-type subunit III [Sphingomonadales bacterium]|nr:cytochrome-c oxidase, cbb3-type subunit III [Sphingomonadales bacterium]MDE2567273.1 cytochrome-c oxidase, cbb3-type subunit III [Sphingomonadales bacterium]